MHVEIQTTTNETIVTGRESRKKVSNTGSLDSPECTKIYLFYETICPSHFDDSQKHFTPDKSNAELRYFHSIQFHRSSFYLNIHSTIRNSNKCIIQYYLLAITITIGREEGQGQIHVGMKYNEFAPIVWYGKFSNVFVWLSMDSMSANPDV